MANVDTLELFPPVQFQVKKAVLNLNSIRDFPITEKNVDILAKMYDPNTAIFQWQDLAMHTHSTSRGIVSLPPELNATLN
jgi:hypothetical protein